MSSCSGLSAPLDDPQEGCSYSISSSSFSANKRSGSALDGSSIGGSVAQPKIRRPKLHSNPIHEEYTLKDGFSTCNHCLAKLKGKNTTTLINHIKAKHPKIHSNYVQKKDNAVKDFEIKKKSEVLMKEPNTAANSNTVTAAIFGTPSVSSLFGRNNPQPKYTYQDPRQKKVTKDIALLISTTILPVSVVSAPSFKRLVAGLNPFARVPERTKMRKEINQLWEEVREALMKAIKVARKVSITTDIWTSKNMVASYLGITIHFFNPDTRTRAAHTIACREFPNPHTGEMIAEKILDICKEFKINDKVDYILCDNGSNMVASFKFMKDVDNVDENIDVFDLCDEEVTEEVIDLEEDSNGNEILLENILDDDLPEVERIDEELEHFEAELDAQDEEVEAEIADHIERDRAIDVTLLASDKKRGRCYAHTMQLAINKVNKLKNQAFGRVLMKGKNYVKKYRTSSKAKYILRKTSYKNRLAGFVQTRWHSDLAMSKSLVEAGEKADKPLALLTEAMNWNIEISVGDIRTLKTFNTLMEPFASKTNFLGGEKYSTVQLHLPTLMELMNQLDDVGAKSGGGVLRYCNKLKSEIEQYFRHVLDPNSADFGPIYHLATFLDPIFSQILTSEQVKISIDALKLRIKADMMKKGEDWENIIENNGEVDSESSKKTQFRGFKHVSNLIASAQSNDKSKSSPFSRDLELYKAEVHRVLLSKQVSSTAPVAAGGAEQEDEDGETNEGEDCPIDDPLDYWAENEAKYETILPLCAQDILCIPATSTPSERLFSASGLLASGVMSNISPVNLEKRVLIKVNVNPGEVWK